VVRISKIIVFSVGTSGIYVLGAYALRKRPRLQNTYLVAFTFVYAIAVVVVVNYYDYFGTLIHHNQIGAAKYLIDIKNQLLYQMADVGDIVLIGFIPIGIVSSFYLFGGWRQKKVGTSSIIPIAGVVGVTLALGLWSLQIARYGSPTTKLDVQGEVMTASHFGFITTYVSMALKTRKQVAQIAYPGTIENDSATDSPVLDGRPNIVFLQIESLDAQATDLTIGRKLVMPFLNSLKKESVYFSHFFAHQHGGGSSDAEIATLMSLLPITSHSGLKTAQYEKIDTLIDVLRESSYTTGVYHSNNGSFYNRQFAYTNFGVDDFHDASSFFGDASGWYAKDIEFYRQSLQLISERDTRSPFFAYLISIQSHGPFRNYSESSRSKFDFRDFAGRELDRNFAMTMHEVDSAIQYLYLELRRNPEFENTLIFIFGDHGSGLFENESAMVPVPLYISHTSLEPRIEQEPASLIDLAPTVSSLGGFRFGKTWLGSSLLSDQPGTVLLRNHSIVRLDDNGALSASRESHPQFQKHIQYSDYLLMGN